MSAIGWIVLLLLVGIVLLFAELVILPGITIAGIGSFCSFVATIIIGFVAYGLSGFWVLLAVLISVGILMVFFLNPKTWNRVALHTDIPNAVEPKAENDIKLGTEGVTLTRLAPMGKILINGRQYEAKSLDSFVDQQQNVIVIGYDNSALVVKKNN